MTNTITILAIAVLAISVPSAFACSEGDIQHWIVIEGDLGVASPLEHATEPDISSTFLIPIPTMGSEIISKTSITQKVADRFNQLGYSQGGGPVEVSDVEVNTGLDFTKGYSTICKNGVMEMVGGMLIQPDATAMFLAYGIANAIWIAPTAAGLAAGIYITKTKWKR